MKMIKMVTENFQGLKGRKEFVFDSKIIVKAGKNGIGKTSFLNAIRYGLTGVEPSGEMIHKGADLSAVTITMESGTVFRREKSADKGNFCYVNGKKVPIGKFDEQISREIPKAVIKVLSSTDELGSLKPEEMEQLLLTYSKNTTKAEVFSFIPGLEGRKKEVLDSIIASDEVTLQDLSSTYTKVYKARAELRKSLEVKKAEMDVLKKNGLVAPMRTDEDIKAALDAASEEQKRAAAYKAEMYAYNQALKHKTKHDEDIAKLKTQIENAKMPEKYEPERREGAEKTLAECQAKRDEALRNAAVFEGNVKTFEKAIHTLDQPVCPLSSKLKCTTDKSGIRKELEESLEQNRKAEKDARESAKASEVMMGKAQRFLKKLDADKLLIEKRDALKEQLEKLEAEVIELPEKPAEVSFDKAKAAWEQIRSEAENSRNYKRYIELRKAFMDEKELYIIYNDLCNDFSNKGVVKEKLLRTFIGDFEDECNKKAVKLGQGKMNIRLVQDSGVTVTADMRGDGNYLEFHSLSGGEKAKVIYVLLAVLSKISGFKLLLIDEMSMLDADGLKELLKLIVDNQDDYDHIFLCMVDHAEALDALKQNGLIA